MQSLRNLENLNEKEVSELFGFLDTSLYDDGAASLAAGCHTLLRSAMRKEREKEIWGKRDPDEALQFIKSHEVSNEEIQDLSLT